jgi:hypothetical protein
MTRSPLRTVLANTVCFALLAWLYGGDLRDALRARTAEVAAFQQLPSPLKPSLVLGVTGAALLVALYGLARRRGTDFRGYRLLPIVLVSALFLDLLFAESEVPLSSASMSQYALQRFGQGAQERSREGRVPTERTALQPLVEELGAPPYLVKGAPLQRYALQVRENCDGPVTQAPGAQVGTLVYCVARGAEGAWVTLVALPSEQRFGPPQVFSTAGRPHVVSVLPLEAPEATLPPQTPEGAFREAPDGKDAGTLPMLPP